MQKKRTYNSQTRKAKAVETRLRILEVAKLMFYEMGYEFVTIDNIAKEAKVSAPTIYALFQSKIGILRALMDEAFPTEKHTAIVDEINREKSAKKRLLLAAKISRQLYDAEREQMDIFRGASVLSPEFKELEIERENRRYIRQEATMKENAERGQLTKDLSLSKARDILWAFTGRDMYRLLVIEKGWSSDEYEEWLGKFLITSLL